jgi:alkylhydroperoxidase family enzyme
VDRSHGPHEERWRGFLEHLDTASTQLTAEARSALLTGAEVPGDLAGFADTVRRHAYRVTDEQVDGLRRAGHGEDELFEVVVLAAAGEADRRLQIVRRAMEGT